MTHQPTRPSGTVSHHERSFIVSANNANSYKRTIQRGINSYIESQLPITRIYVRVSERTQNMCTITIFFDCYIPLPVYLTFEKHVIDMLPLKGQKL